MIHNTLVPATLVAVFVSCLCSWGATTINTYAYTFSVKTGVLWELGCTPHELHQEMVIFGETLQQKWDCKCARCREGKWLATSVMVKSGLEPINKHQHMQIKHNVATSTPVFVEQHSEVQLELDNGGEAPRVHKV